MTCTVDQVNSISIEDKVSYSLYNLPPITCTKQHVQHAGLTIVLYIPGLFSICQTLPALPHLFSHWLWVGDCCGEEAVPLQATIEARPMVVSVASVRQTPWNEGTKLLVHWVTCLARDTRAHSS